jgi:Domain of unknown function (DUF397)
MNGYERRSSEFIKSSLSSAANNNCVEVSVGVGEVRVRDSKNPAAGTLEFTLAEWDAFLAGVKAGEFDLN